VNVNIFDYIHKYIVNIKLQCVLEYIRENAKNLNGEPENDQQVMQKHSILVNLKKQLQSLL
jgi:hypothetical protein